MTKKVNKSRGQRVVRPWSQRPKRSPYDDLDLGRKIEQSDNRQKLFASLDSDTAKFARREFAKLGLF
jgi:hypothetical protein